MKQMLSILTVFMVVMGFALPLAELSAYSYVNYSSSTSENSGGSYSDTHSSSSSSSESSSSSSSESSSSSSSSSSTSVETEVESDVSVSSSTYVHSSTCASCGSWGGCDDCDECEDCQECEECDECDDYEECDDCDDCDEDEDCDGSIGDLVWLDRNKNGVRDAGEEGLSGVTVKLHRGNDTEKDNTGAKGQYEFDDLCKGKYTVVVDANDLGAGCYPTYDRDGKLDHQTVVRLDDDDDDYMKADFGYYCPIGKTAPRTGAGGIGLAISGGVASLAAFATRKRFMRRD